MTDDALAAELRADPDTAELAEELGLSVEQYVAATLKYLADPDAGFLGCRDSPDCEHGDDDDEAPESSFEPSRRPLVRLS